MFFSDSLSFVSLDQQLSLCQLFSLGQCYSYVIQHPENKDKENWFSSPNLSMKTRYWKLRYSTSKTLKDMATGYKGFNSLNSSKIYLLNKKALTVKHGLIYRKMDLTHIFIVVMFN